MQNYKRDTLEKYNKKQIIVYATFDRYARTKWHKTTDKTGKRVAISPMMTYCITDVIQGISYITDHMWIASKENKWKQIKELKIRHGEIIKITGEVGTYKSAKTDEVRYCIDLVHSISRIDNWYDRMVYKVVTFKLSGFFRNSGVVYKEC